MASEKSPLTKHLRKYYIDDICGKSFVNVVVIKGEGLKTLRKRPIESLTNALI
jgi:hypothetical protein